MGTMGEKLRRPCQFVFVYDEVSHTLGGSGEGGTQEEGSGEEVCEWEG